MGKQHQGYEVGYRKPPRQHQFKPGRSGNPEGRRRKRKRAPPSDLSESICHALLKEQRAQVNGREMLVPGFVLLGELLVRDALNASFKDRLLLIRYFVESGICERLREIQEEEKEEEPIFSDEDRAYIQRLRLDYSALLQAREAGDL